VAAAALAHAAHSYCRLGGQRRPDATELTFDAGEISAPVVCRDKFSSHGRQRWQKIGARDGKSDGYKLYGQVAALTRTRR